MSKWSEGAELLQKIITAKEVIPVQSDLIALQQTLFSLQSDQMKLVDENVRLKAEVDKLKKKATYVYDEDHTWMINPGNPRVKLCPTCLNRDGFENPTVPNGSHAWCSTCQKDFK